MCEDTSGGRGDGAGEAWARDPHGAGLMVDLAVDLVAVFAALPGIDLVLAPDAPRYTMLAATEGRLAATMTTREGTLGRPLFEVFPDANPDNAAASGVGNLRASLDTVLRTRAPHRMAVQRYDLRRPDGTWEERHWAPLNVPVLGPDGAVRYLIHRVEDVTDLVRLAAEGDRLRGAVTGSERARAHAEAARAEVAAAHAQLADAHVRLQEQALELELAYQQLQEQAAELEATTETLQATAAELEAQVADTDAERVRLAGVLGAMGDAHVALDRDWRVIAMNRQAERVNLRPASDFLGRDHWEAWPASVGTRIEREYRRAMAERVPVRLEANYHEPGVLDTWVELDVVPTADGGVGVFFRDISARKRAEAAREEALAAERAARAEAEAARADAVAARLAADEARRAAEGANRAKGEFLAVMSHELRTPLNAIGGHVELVELGIHGPVTAEQCAALARVQRAQRHLLGLINGVLNYARVEAGAVHYAVEEVPLDEVLATCEALIAPQVRARGLTLRHDACDGALRIRADRDKVQQVVLNLLSNAVKFTDPGGAVTLECEAGSDAGGAAGGGVRVRVRDTGRGIAPDQLSHIFEPFVQLDAALTRTREGTGLGLAISRDLARGMGANLTVESAVGVGSTFTLTLPSA